MASPECTDAIGNKLHKNDLVRVAPEGQQLIGEILELHQGGISVVGDKVTPARMTIQILIEVGGPPGVAFRTLLALRHPTAKEQSVILGNES